MLEHDRFASHKMNGRRGKEQRKDQIKDLEPLLNGLGPSKDKEYWMQVCGFFFFFFFFFYENQIQKWCIYKQSIT